MSLERIEARDRAKLIDDAKRLMKQCQRGVGGWEALDEAHDIMATAYGTVGRLISALGHRP